MIPDLKPDPETVRVLDVTLRDGGYLNDWAFSSSEMCDLVRLLDTGAVEYVEIGYLDDYPRAGLSAGCPPDLVHELGASATSLRLAAMLRPTVRFPREVLRARSESLDLIRIPTHAVRVDASLEVADHVRAAGVGCSINLTNVSIYSETEILTAVDRIAESGVADVIYLADSRGALAPNHVAGIVRAVRDRWPGPLGFHAHDNLGRALANALTALNHGCTFVDGSVDGLGQGVGNASLQGLLQALGRWTDLDTDPLSAFADDLSLPEKGCLLEVYRLTGMKNVSQDWVPDLDRLFGHKLPALLRRTDRAAHRDEDDLLAVLRFEQAADVQSG